MYHIVYLTTNLVNLKIYVGVHSTYNLEDGYLGSGKIIKRAIKKNSTKISKCKFKRDILFFCNTAEDAYEIEARIVDSSFLNRPDTYNVTLGGRTTLVHHLKGKTYEEAYGKNKALKLKKLRSKTHKGKVRTQEEKDKQSKSRQNYIVSDETRLKLSHSTKGCKNRIAKKFLFISPTNDEYIVHGEFKNFCNIHKLSKHILTYYRNVVISPSMVVKEKISKTNTLGWFCKEL